MKLAEITKTIFSSKKLMYFLILANLIGAVYGFVFYYGKQFLETPLYLWLFVPDCPLFSLFFAICLLLILLKKENSFFFFLSLAGALKYGFWTVFVLLFFNEFYFTPENFLVYSVLLISHIFLFIESFLLIKKIKFKFYFFLLSLLFFIANDLSDYFLNTRPGLPLTELNFMFYFTLISSFVFILLALFLVKKLNKKN
ncbi:MAG: DUF1405 domain-containing protein [Candidatus Micrarchaeota archaeon]